jgi:ABC-2 type transport system ATP-binding protein
MITIDRVSKKFGRFPAVKEMSVTVADGEIFGLVGPNGAGKTTTIKMMTGLLRPDSGRILIGNYDITEDPMKAKSVLGYVPDRAFLYEKLTAREFLVFTSSMYGIGKSDALVRIEHFLSLLGIPEMEDSLIESFSQGMRQRLLFATALVHDPGVLLIDEPFTGLDPFGVRTLREIIDGLCAKGISVFLATHSLHIAEGLCHRIGFINKGSLVSLKDRKEIRDTEGGLEGMFLRVNG